MKDRFALLRSAGWLLVLAMFLATGCASTGKHVYFKPTDNLYGSDRTAVPMARILFPEDAEKRVSVKLMPYGLFEQKDQEKNLVPFGAFGFKVKNKTDGDLVIDPSRFELTDDEGRVSIDPKVEVYEGELPIRLAPGEKTRFDMLFRLSDETRVERVGSVRLAWEMFLDGDVFPMQLKFVRNEIQDPFAPNRFRLYLGVGMSYPRHRNMLLAPPIGYPYDYLYDPWFWYDDPYWLW